MRTTLALLAAIAAIATVSAQQPRFSARVDLLVVSAIVRSADNSLTRGLVQDDFELREDGKAVPISTFAEVHVDAATSVDDGRFVVLVLDNLAADAVYTARIKQIAHQFADRMGPKDIMSVVYLNGSNSVTTQHPGEVRRAIDRMKPTGTNLMGTQGAGQHAMQAVSSLSAQLARVGHRRKVMVFVGPAQIFNPPLHEGELQGYAGQSVRDTARADVTTYLIDPLGLTEKPQYRPRAIDSGDTTPDSAGSPSTLAKGMGFGDYDSGFVRETGGRVFANTNFYDEAVTQVWEESGSYYLLGYEPAKRDNKRHDIDVRVKKPEVQVRARRIRG